MIRHICVLILLFNFSAQALAQSISFTASTDAKEIVEGGYVDVTFTLENGKGTNFKPPTFSGFSVVSGPMSSSQVSIVNGRSSQRMSYSYTLLSKGLGNKSIGAASIKVNGREYKTKPVSVRVVKASKKNLSEAKNSTFINLELSDSTVYKGQQVTMKYVIYTTVDVASANFRTDETFDGFFVNRIRNYRDRAERVVIDGVQYTKKTLKTYALFPQQTGTFNFDPVTVTIGVPVKNERRGFFFSSKEKRENIITSGGSIVVKSTPNNAPVSYSGAVGKFRMQSGFDKRSITTDDAITMKMKITGNGDNKFLIAPTQPANDDWEIYDPNALGEEINQDGDQVVAIKNYEYLMVPKRPGKLLLRPEFTYFDTDSMRYITLYGNHATVNVVRGTGDSTLEDAIEQEKLTLAPIISNTKFSQQGKSFMYSPAYWLGMSLPLFSLLGVFMYKKKLIKEDSIDPTARRESEADAVAKARLSKAQDYRNQGEEKSFYSEVNDALYGYVSDKLNIPAADLSRSNIQSQLSAKAVPDAMVDSFVKLLDKVQMSLYAGGGTDMQSLYQEAVTAISGLDSQL